MEIEFSGYYDKKEYFSAIYMAGKPSKRSLIYRVGFFVIFLGLTIGYAVMSRDITNPGDLVSGRMIRYAAGLLILAYFNFLPYITIRQTASRIWKDPVIRGHISGSVNSQGIRYGQNTQLWETFSHKFMTKDLAVLVTTGRNMACLPRHFFASDADWDGVCRIINEKVIEARV